MFLFTFKNKILSNYEIHESIQFMIGICPYSKKKSTIFLVAISLKSITFLVAYSQNKKNVAHLISKTQLKKNKNKTELKPTKSRRDKINLEFV